MRRLECPRCGAEMVEGFLLDRSEHGARAAQWVEGKPVYGFLRILKLRGRKKLAIQSWRCRKCGALEWFAPEGGD
jgi:ribosomal protein S27AE